jgi:hypothetical protein
MGHVARDHEQLATDDVHCVAVGGQGHVAVRVNLVPNHHICQRSSREHQSAHDTSRATTPRTFEEVSLLDLGKRRPRFEEMLQDISAGAHARLQRVCRPTNAAAHGTRVRRRRRELHATPSMHAHLE